MNCAPRGSVTGGREVADKRELYKIGCRPRIRREGEGAPYGESGRMPVGHPVGASNAIFHRSRLNRQNVLFLSFSALVCSRDVGEWRKGAEEEEEEEEKKEEGAHVGARVGPICQI